MTERDAPVAVDVGAPGEHLETADTDLEIDDFTSDGSHAISGDGPELTAFRPERLRLRPAQRFRRPGNAPRQVVQ